MAECVECANRLDQCCRRPWGPLRAAIADATPARAVRGREAARTGGARQALSRSYEHFWAATTATVLRTDRRAEVTKLQAHGSDVAGPLQALARPVAGCVIRRRCARALLAFLAVLGLVAFPFWQVWHSLHAGLHAPPAVASSGWD